MQATTQQLNPTQIHLLKLFANNQTESSMTKLKKVLFEFYCSEVERMGAEIAAAQHLDDAKLEAMSHEHHRSK